MIEDNFDFPSDASSEPEDIFFENSDKEMLALRENFRKLIVKGLQVPKKVKLVLLDKLDKNMDRDHSHRKEIGLPVGEILGHSHGKSLDKRNSDLFRDHLNMSVITEGQLISKPLNIIAIQKT